MMSNLDAYNLLMTSNSIPKVQSEKRVAAVPREASSIVMVMVVVVVVVAVVLLVIPDPHMAMATAKNAKDRN